MPKRPAPTPLRVLRGARPSRIGYGEPVPPPGRPDCPGGLSDAARDVWDEVAPVAYGMGVLTVADVEAFALLCVTVAECRRLRALCAASTPLIDTRRHGDGPNLVRNPAFVMLPRFIEAERRALAEFGLTPAARASMRWFGSPPDERESLLTAPIY